MLNPSNGPLRVNIRVHIFCFITINRCYGDQSPMGGFMTLFYPIIDKHHQWLLLSMIFHYSPSILGKPPIMFPWYSYYSPMISLLHSHSLPIIWRKPPFFMWVYQRRSPNLRCRMEAELQHMRMENMRLRLRLAEAGIQPLGADFGWLLEQEKGLVV